jgi:hypothetical protein
LGGVSNLTFNGTFVSLNAFHEPLSAISADSSSLDIDCRLANNFYITLNTDVTTFTISNPPPINQVYSIVLWIEQGSGGSHDITWSGSTISWGGPNTPPVLSTSVGKVDIINLITINGGTKWFGFLAGTNF